MENPFVINIVFSYNKINTSQWCLDFSLQTKYTFYWYLVSIKVLNFLVCVVTYFNGKLFYVTFYLLYCILCTVLLLSCWPLMSLGDFPNYSKFCNLLILFKTRHTIAKMRFYHHNYKNLKDEFLLWGFSSILGLLFFIWIN